MDSWFLHIIARTSSIHATFTVWHQNSEYSFTRCQSYVADLSVTSLHETGDVSLLPV